MVYVLLTPITSFYRKCFQTLKVICGVSLSRSKKMESSYEDLDNASETIDTVELQESAPDKETALLGRRVPRLVRQASIMETPLDSSGSMKMTYWFQERVYNVINVESEFELHMTSICFQLVSILVLFCITKSPNCNPSWKLF